MKRRLISLFIIFNLLAMNMAFAVSVYDENEQSEAHSLLHGAAPDLSSSSDSSNPEPLDCNHFCHISAHLFGLSTQPPSILNVQVKNVYLLPYEQQENSQALEPPLHPPSV